MRMTQTVLALAILACSAPLAAQSPANVPERGVYLTIFRSPATGVELRRGHAAVHAGFYPTILSRDGRSDNTNFIRVGATYYLRARGSTPYITPSLMVSLDPDWKHGALTELGFRATLYRALHGRLGAAVLTTTDGAVRVNPTVGMDVRVGGSR